MLRAGDVVLAEFPGAQGIKRRPAIVLSTELYQRTRPDVLIGLVTTNIAAAKTPTDHVINDWRLEGCWLSSALGVPHLSGDHWPEVYAGHWSSFEYGLDSRSNVPSGSHSVVNM